MSTIVQEPAADVVVLGLGVTSGTIAAELSIAGYKVAGVTRGPYWNYATDFASTKYDEWGVQWERKYDFPASLQTMTIRNNSNQFALPTRRATFPIQYHSLGFGVGGAAHHYGGAMGRAGVWHFTMASETASRYGADFLPTINAHDDTQDWPTDYAHYEPYYTAWEQAFGLSGDGNGSYDGAPIAMSKNYPMPPHPVTPLGSAFQAATEALGYNPYPSPSSLASQPYVNTYGVQVNACVYEGWCTGGGCNFACETGAKANSAFRSVPAAVKTGNFTMSLNSEIFRMDTDPTTGLVTAIRYYDSGGNIHVQPGKVFYNGLWGSNQVRAMLLSGVGVPYNPVTVTGTVGRGFTNGYLPYTATAGPSGMVPIGINALAGNGTGGGYTIYEFMDDGFDHTGLNFIGGALQSAGGYAGSGPTNVSTAGGASSGSQGSKYKATLKNKYQSTGMQRVGLGGQGPDLPNTKNMWDLDPHYVDAWGDPCMRTTHDWTNNPYNTATYFASAPGNAPLIAILQKLGATNISPGGTPVPAGSAHNDWWGHHIRGGNRVGKDPASSTFNVWNQAWACPNLFAAGEVNNTTGDTTPSGTHQAGFQAEIASEGIQQYLKTPELLTGSI